MSLAKVHYGARPHRRHRANVCGWLTVHGIDPAGVSLPGWIGWDDEARQILYTAWDFDEWNAAGRRDLVLPTRTVTVQLESPPLPFPVMLRDETYLRHCPEAMR